MFGSENPRIQVKPPLRGIFPLDKQGVCDDLVKQYLGALKESVRLQRQLTKAISAPVNDLESSQKPDDVDNFKLLVEKSQCKHQELAKAYILCRQQHNLMQSEDWDFLRM